MNQSAQFLTNYTSACLVVSSFYWFDLCYYCSSRCWAKPFQLFHSMPWWILFLFHNVVYTLKKNTPNIKKIHEITSGQKGWFPRRLFSVLLKLRCIFQAWFQSCKNGKKYVEKIHQIATSTTGINLSKTQI